MDENVRKQITSLMQSIEKEHNIKILYVCESGSRAMKIHDQSPLNSSDFDIRFCYLHPLPFYLQVVEEQPSEIRKKFNIKIFPPIREKNTDKALKEELKEEGKEEEGLETEVDFVGYEYRKTLLFTRKSNPTVLEWFLQTDVVYYVIDKEWLIEMKNLWMNYYLNRKTIVYHYLNTVKDNYTNYLRNKDQVNRKKYIYILRCLLWIEYIRLTYCEFWMNNDNAFLIDEDVIIPPFVVDDLLSQVLEKQKLCLERRKNDHLKENCICLKPIEVKVFDKQEEALKEFNLLIERKKSSSGQWEKEPRIPVLDDWIFFLRQEEKLFADKVLANEKRKIDQLTKEQETELQAHLDKLFYEKVVQFDSLPSAVINE
ncbi:hypothetical protein ABK040_010408 [Willaertia magna]